MSGRLDRGKGRANQDIPRVDRLLLGGLLILCCGLGIVAAAVGGQAESPLLQLTELGGGRARPDQALQLSLGWLIRWAGLPLGLSWLGLLCVAKLNSPRRRSGGDAETKAGTKAGTGTAASPGPLALLPGGLCVASGCALMLPALLAASSAGPTHAATGLIRFTGAALLLLALASITTAGLIRAGRPRPAPQRGAGRPALELAQLRRRRSPSPTPGPQEQGQQTQQR